MPTTISQFPVQSRFPGQIAHWDRIDRKAVAIKWLRELRAWVERSRQRIALRELADGDEHLLDDIGKSKEEALREAVKPFWKA